MDDKWTRDNQTVTLKELLDIVKDIPTSNIPTKKLIKHALHGDNPDELKSIENANLNAPIKFPDAVKNSTESNALMKISYLA